MTATANRTTVTKAVHFNLEGAWLADMARTRLEEGDWAEALGLLTKSLEGMTHELAQSIVTGRGTLTGWACDPEGLGYEKLADGGELALQMDKIQHFLYGSCFRFQGSHWQPYAVVSSFGDEDKAFGEQGEGTMCTTSGFSDDRYGYARRALFYANNRVTDLVVHVVHPSAAPGTVVLCAPAKMPPLWWTTPRGAPEEVLAELLGKGHRWSVRGAEPDERSAPTGPAQGAVEALPLPLETPGSLVNGFLAKLNAAISLEAVQQVQQEYDQRLGVLRRAEAQGTQTDEAYAQVEAEEALAWSERLAQYRSAIEKQADQHGGWLTLAVLQENGAPFESGGALRIPKNAFLRWCLKGYNFEAHGKTKPEWKNVCPTGMKMAMDDPNHTDWMVGAGLDPEGAYELDGDTYGRRVQSAAYTLRFSQVHEWTDAQFVILSRGTDDWIHGETVLAHPHEAVKAGSIAIVPHAGPEYQLAMESACRPGRHGQRGAVICETGGKLAHLAIVGRESRSTLLLVPDARKRFPEGTALTLNLRKGVLSWAHL